MNLNEQLEVERKKKGLSKRQLTKIIEDEIGKKIHVDTIRRWEVGETTIETRVLVFLSELYDVTIEDLVFEDVEPVIDDKEVHYKFGKEISDYCSVENITEFVRKYEIVNGNHWVVAPKYDLIMRCYEDFLKTDQVSQSSCYSAYESCRSWLTNKRVSCKDEDRLSTRIYDDAAGYVGIKDKRDPVDHIDLLEELETVIDDIEGYLELFEKEGVNRWEFI